MGSLRECHFLMELVFSQGFSRHSIGPVDFTNMSIILKGFLETGDGYLWKYGEWREKGW